jgi:cell wall-associated NlpC family hydrolase
LTDVEQVAHRCRVAIDGLRQELTQRHGWTRIEVEVRVEAPQRVALRGEAVVDRVVDAVVRRVMSELPDGWTVDTQGLTPLRGGAWHSLQPGVHRLFARLDRQTSGWGAWVELTECDDPVQVLDEVQGMTLVRGRDATVGWLQEGLGDETSPVPIEPPVLREPQRMIESAREMLEVVYVLGGATRAGVDCSSLVQRAAAELGLLLPRHSSDQLQIDPREGMGSAAGDLAFAWNEREALCHVGIVTGPTVLHASLSRRRVLEDPLSAFASDSRRLMFVPFESLLAFGERVAGFASLTAAGFAVGRPPPPLPAE